MTTKTYVEFFWAGSFTANTQAQPVDHRDETRVPLPDGAYGFRFFDRTEVETTGGEKLVGDRKNFSKMFYPGGRVMSADEIEAQGDPNNRILLSNMRGNGWPFVVYSRFGNWPQPYDPAKDAVLPLATA